MSNDLLLALRALNYAQLRQLAASNRLSEALDAQHVAYMDSYEAIVAAYHRTVRRAQLSWYTRSTRQRTIGASRRYRVAMRRVGFPNAIGV